MLTMCEEHVVKAMGERNLPRLAFRRFRVADVEDAIVEVDVLPTLAEDLSPAHSGVERAEDDPLQVLGRCGKEQVLLTQAQDWALGSAFPLHAQPSHRVRGKVSFLDSPIEDSAEDREIAVDGGGGERFLPVPLLPVLPDGRRVDLQEQHVGEEWQEVLQPVERVRLPHPVSDEERGEFSERHRGLQLRQPVTTFVQLIAELALDGFGLAAVGCAGGVEVTNAVDPHSAPPRVFALVERHGLYPSLPLLLKNPLDDLVTKEDQLAHRARTKVRQSLR